MKNVYLLVLALLSFSLSRAQINKGDVLLGGNIQHTNYNQAYAPALDKENMTTVGPSFGWAVKDNLEFGTRLLYSFAKSDQNYPSQSPPYHYTLEFTRYGLALYIRQYKDLGHRFAIFVEGDLVGSGGRTKITNVQVAGLFTNQKSWNIDAALTAGIAYRVAHRWMFEAGFSSLASAGYEHIRDNGQDVTMDGASGKTSYFSLGTNFSQALQNFSFGCRYILN
ncbi:MAG TPA: outer membrane beta-barrel protein [Puia sp.]